MFGWQNPQDMERDGVGVGHDREGGPWGDAQSPGQQVELEAPM